MQTTNPTIVHVGPYPPTQCGIATFTASLRDAVAAEQGRSVPDVIRILEAPTAEFSPVVVADWVHGDRDSLSAVMEKLSQFDMAILQHEFGIFAGPDGESVLEFVRACPIPVVTVLHTIVSSPSPRQRDIVEELCRRSVWTIAQSEAARARLIENHDIEPRRVLVIPHGAEGNEQGPAHRLGPSDRPLVLSWGLLGPGKGFERAIEAMSRMQCRDATYAIVGQTHPRVRQRSGEEYHESLRALGDSLGLGERLVFDSEYHDWSTLRAIVRGADVVLLPYDTRDQVTSGVLVEALASAKPVVATRFPHAIEVLRGGAGIVVNHDPIDMAAALDRILGDPALARCMADNARREAKTLLWPTVAQRYLELGRRTDEVEVHAMAKPDQSAAAGVVDLREDVIDADTAERMLRHVIALTDEVSINEHASNATPREPREYCVDDAGRALALVSVLHAPQSHSLADRYLSFLEDASVGRGRFVLRRGPERRWKGESDDASARSLLGIATAAAQAPWADIRHRARALWAGSGAFVTPLPAGPGLRHRCRRGAVTPRRRCGRPTDHGHGSGAPPAPACTLWVAMAGGSTHLRKRTAPARPVDRR